MAFKYMAPRTIPTATGSIAPFGLSNLYESTLDDDKPDNVYQAPSWVREKSISTLKESVARTIPTIKAQREEEAETARKEARSDFAKGLEYTGKSFVSGAKKLGAAILDMPNTLVYQPYAKAQNAVADALDWVFGTDTSANRMSTTLYGETENIGRLFKGKERVKIGDNPIIENIKQSAKQTDVARQNLDVGLGWKLAGSVAENLPLQATILLSTMTGVPLWQGATLSQSIGEVDPLTGTDREYISAILSGAVSVAVENSYKLFGAFAKNKNMIEAATEPVSFILRATDGKKPLVQFVGKLLDAGYGEGMEEILEYPFQQFIDWRGRNPDAPASDYYNLQKLGEWGFAGLAGFAGGVLLGSAGALKGNIETRNDRILSANISQIATKPIEELTVDEVMKTADLLYDHLQHKDLTQTTINYENQKSASISTQANAPTTTIQPDTAVSMQERSNIITEEAKGLKRAPSASRVQPEIIKASKNAIPTNAEPITLDEKLKTVVYRDETTGNFVIVEPVTGTIVGNAEKLNDAVTQTRAQFDDTKTYAKFATAQTNANLEDVRNTDINNWATITPSQDVFTQVENRLSRTTTEQPVSEQPKAKEAKAKTYTGTKDLATKVSALKSSDISETVTKAFNESPSVQTEAMAKVPTREDAEIALAKAQMQLLRMSKMGLGAMGGYAGPYMSLMEFDKATPIEKQIAADIALLNAILKKMEEKTGADANKNVSSVIRNWLLYLTQTIDENRTQAGGDPTYWEKIFSDTSWMYTVMHGKAIADDAAKEANALDNSQESFARVLGEIGSIQLSGNDSIDARSAKILTKAGMYAFRMSQSDNAVDQAHGMQIRDMLSKLGRSAGRLVKQFDFLYSVMYPARVADSTVKDFNRRIKERYPVEGKKAEDAGTETSGVINGKAKEEFPEAIRDVAKPPKRQDVVRRLFRSFSRKVDNISNQKEKTTVQKMVLELHKIFNENVPTDRQKTTGAEAFAEIMANREQYSDVWSKVYALMEQRYPQDLPLLQKYFAQEYNDTASLATMDRVISETANEMLMKVPDVLARVWVNREVTLTQIFTAMRSLMPDTVTDEQFEAAKEAITERLEQRMYQARMDVVLRLNKTRAAKINQANERVLQDQTSKRDLEFVNKLIRVSFAGNLGFKNENIRQMWAEKFGLPYLSEEHLKVIEKAASDLISESDPDKVHERIAKLHRDLGKLIPSRLLDRYFSFMRSSLLIMPVTLIKNMGSNNLHYIAASITNHVMAMVNRHEKIFTLGVEMSEEDRRTLMVGKRFVKKGENAAIDSLASEWAKRRNIILGAMTSKYAVPGEELAPIFKTKWLEAYRQMSMSLTSTGTFTPELMDKTVNKIKNEKARNIVTKAMRALGDEEISERYFEVALRQRFAKAGYNESMTDAQKQEVLSDVVPFALEDALEITYRKKNVIGRLMSGAIKSVTENIDRYATDLANKGHIKEARTVTSVIRPLAQILTRVPAFFVNTVSAVGVASYRYSPLNLAVSMGELIGWRGLITLQDSKRFEAWADKSNFGKRIDTMLGSKVDKADFYSIMPNVIKGGVGSIGIFLPAMILGILGVLTPPDYPDSDREKELWKQLGKKPNSIYIEGKGSFSLDFMQPFALTVMLGGAIGNRIRDGGSISDGKFLTSAIERAITTDNVLSNFFDAFQKNPYSDAPRSEQALEIAMDFLTMGLPRLGKAAARTVDPTVREIYGGSTGQVFMNRVLEYVPFASYAIAPQIDVWGDPVKRVNNSGGIIVSAWRNFFSPFYEKDADKNPETAEVDRVFKVTGDPDSLPMLASTKVKINNQIITLSGDEWIEFQKRYGSLQKQAVNDLMSGEIKHDGKLYQNMTDSERTTALRYYYEKANEIAKLEVYNQYFPDDAEKIPYKSFE